MTSHDKQPPHPVTVAVVLAALSAALGVIFAIGLVLHASKHADAFLRDHPHARRSSALAGSYGAAAFTTLLAAVKLFAARALRRGQRWAWIVLGILVLLGLPGLLQANVPGVTEGVLSLALLVTLLLPASRQYTNMTKTRVPSA